VEVLQSLVVEAAVDDRHATIVLRTPCDGVEHRAVVGPVAACLDDHRPLDAEPGVKCCQGFLRGVFRRVAAARRIGKYGSGAEDVAMGVATSGGRSEGWRLLALADGGRGRCHVWM